MNRVDRALGILLALRAQPRLSAQALAERFEVSTRTIYRDVEALAELGIPVFAEMGRNGGFRLMDGYFLPPVSFSFAEAMSVMLGLAFLRSTRVRPYPEAIGSAEAKIIAAMPEPTHSQLQRAAEIIGLEAVPADLLHPEDDDPQQSAPDSGKTDLEAQVIGSFLTAVVERKWVDVDYRSPYRKAQEGLPMAPAGVIWDRDRWYLVGQVAGKPATPRTLRADRVGALRVTGRPVPAEFDCDVRTLLNRRWLAGAMKSWAASSPVRIRMSPKLATRLSRDWYYRYAVFEADGDAVVMTYGEGSRSLAFALLRWLGPDAELLEPRDWRENYGRQLEQMAARYRQ